MSLAMKAGHSHSSRLRPAAVEDSIQESIDQSKAIDTDIIEEDIPEESNIKLSKARMALGSESAVRE